MSKDWESEFANDELEKYNLKALLDNLNDKDKKTMFGIMIKHKVVEIDDTGVDMTTPKYKLVLRFLNLILVNIGKRPISKVTEFKGVDRLDIIRQENMDSFEEIEDEVLELYDKKDIKFYDKNKVDTYVLSFLRSSCCDLGLDFGFYRKNIYTKGSRSKHAFYSIKNN